VITVELPDQLPLVMQDIDIMRCTTCGAILPGTWGISRELNQPGVDHYLDRHRADVVAERCPRPPIVNCAIQDPFWFEEHA
jgi:hypothetical protein